MNNLFRPPPEREIYLLARDQLDLDIPEQFEETKKLLMRRAIATIPLVIALQNEGNSVEKLYRKGMLTDDMHYRVSI